MDLLRNQMEQKYGNPINAYIQEGTTLSIFFSYTSSQIYINYTRLYPISISKWWFRKNYEINNKVTSQSYLSIYPLYLELTQPFSGSRSFVRDEDDDDNDNSSSSSSRSRSNSESTLPAVVLPQATPALPIINQQQFIPMGNNINMNPMNPTYTIPTNNYGRITT